MLTRSETMKVIHFKSQEERLAYLKGGLEEVVPKKAEKPEEKPKEKKSKKEDKE